MEELSYRRTREDEHAASERNLELLDEREKRWMRTTPWWVTDEHRQEFRCDLCDEPLGFQEADGVGGKLYHQFCRDKLPRKGKEMSQELTQEANERLLNKMQKASPVEDRPKNYSSYGERSSNLPARLNLGPTSFSELEKFAKLLSNSNFVPAVMKGKPGDILAAVQFGAEVGLPPMQALQNIAVINGKPSIYGDAIPGICMTHPDWEGYEEEFAEGTMTASCSVRRRGMKPKVATFSQADAELAGLWRKAGPWTQYPKRMLAWRAKGFAFRDAFPDALKGLISREEASDYITLPAQDFQPVETETLLPDELDSHIAKMEEAFVAGEGEDWWTKYSNFILSRCTQEQKKRINDRKNELKNSGASPDSAVSPPSASGGASDTESQGKAGGRHSGKAVMLRDKMKEASSLSGFFEDNKDALAELSQRDYEWIQSESDALAVGRENRGE